MTDPSAFILISPLVRSNALEAVRAAPDGWRVKVAPPLRSDDQNSKMWAMLADVARALDAGLAAARDFAARGLIEGAALFLQGQVRAHGQLSMPKETADA